MINRACHAYRVETRRVFTFLIRCCRRAYRLRPTARCRTPRGTFSASALPSLSISQPPAVGVTRRSTWWPCVKTRCPDRAVATDMCVRPNEPTLFNYIGFCAVLPVCSWCAYVASCATAACAQCDANAVCGVRCVEIDLLEANRHAFHVTAHHADDDGGDGTGLGGVFGTDAFGPQAYGPHAATVDTTQPFRVGAFFATDDQGQLRAIEMTITGAGGGELTFAMDHNEYLRPLTESMQAGLTPTASYWSSVDLTWLQGGVCPPGRSEQQDACGETVTFSHFEVHHGRVAPPPPRAPTPVDEAEEPPLTMQAPPSAPQAASRTAPSEAPHDHALDHASSSTTSSVDSWASYDSYDDHESAMSMMPPAPSAEPAIPSHPHVDAFAPSALAVLPHEAAEGGVHVPSSSFALGGVLVLLSAALLAAVMVTFRSRYGAANGKGGAADAADDDRVMDDRAPRQSRRKARAQTRGGGGPKHVRLDTAELFDDEPVVSVAVGEGGDGEMKAARPSRDWDSVLD